VTAYSTVPVHHTRLAAQRVASSFAVGFSTRGGRSRSRDPSGDARVFRPCSRDAEPSCDMGSAERIQRSRTPCAHRLGERTKRQRLGRVMSPRDVTRQPPRRRAIIPEPGPRVVRAGLAPIRPGAPRAFHGVDDLDTGAADESPDIITEGRSSLAAFARPSTLLRGE